MKNAWLIRLTAAADADFESIVRWTEDRFGTKQAREYAETLSLAIAALSDGPSVAGVRSRADILKGLYALHVARRGRKGRHFVMFQIGNDRGRQVIEILRLLHDSMDLPRHLSQADDAP